MLLRFDPFRDFDWLTREILGAGRVPQPMPMDCYRDGDTFVLHFDLPGIDIETLEVSEENNNLTVSAQRRAVAPEEAVYLVAEQVQPRRIEVGRRQDSGGALPPGGNRGLSGPADAGEPPAGTPAS